MAQRGNKSIGSAMSDDRTIVIVGASARAAAFSALRAGLAPWCADLFADADLAARCPAIAVAPSDYPHKLPEIVRSAPPGPWMFTGGLENRAKLVEQISRERSLWGCPPDVLRATRDPINLARVFARAGIPFPESRTTKPESSDNRTWLSKPRDGAGGIGIDWFCPSRRTNKRTYYQEFLEGPSMS